LYSEGVRTAGTLRTSNWVGFLAHVNAQLRVNESQKARNPMKLIWMWRTLMVGFAWLLSSEAAAAVLRQGPYANVWSADAPRYIVQLEGQGYVASILTGTDPANPVGTRIGSGSISDLQAINECQFMFMNALMTQQACEMAFDDTVSALRPDGTVVIPDIWFYPKPGVEAHYRVEMRPIVQPGAAMALEVTKVELTSKRSSDPRFFNLEQGRLDVTVFVPTAKDCIETYAATLVRSAASAQIFLVKKLAFAMQYQWWGGENDAVCPFRPYQVLID
jgi:hypothetical protein